jgi:hypothetical protein
MEGGQLCVGDRGEEFIWQDLVGLACRQDVFPQTMGYGLIYRLRWFLITDKNDLFLPALTGILALARLPPTRAFSCVGYARCGAFVNMTEP